MYRSFLVLASSASPLQEEKEEKEATSREYWYFPLFPYDLVQLGDDLRLIPHPYPPGGCGSKTSVRLGGVNVTIRSQLQHRVEPGEIQCRGRGA